MIPSFPAIPLAVSIGVLLAELMFRQTCWGDVLGVASDGLQLSLVPVCPPRAHKEERCVGASLSPVSTLLLASSPPSIKYG